MSLVIVPKHHRVIRINGGSSLVGIKLLERKWQLPFVGNSTGYQNLLAPSAQVQNFYSFVFCLRPPQIFAKMTQKQLHIKGPFLNTPTAALRLAKPSDPMSFTNAFPGWSLWRTLVLPRHQPQPRQSVSENFLKLGHNISTLCRYLDR